MSTSEPKPGAQYKLDGQIYEVISINDDVIAMCSLIHKYRRFIKRIEFASMEVKGKLVLHKRAASDVTPIVRWISMSDLEKHKIECHQAYVDACLDGLGGTLPREAAKVMIAQVAARIGDSNPPGITTVWRWKKRYLVGDRHPLSLARKKPSPRRKRILASSEELVRHYIKTSYLLPERPSLAHAYRLLKSHILHENNERLRCGGNPQQTPSYATFRRRVLAMDRYYVTERRMGGKAAKRLNKASGKLFIDDDPYACTVFDSHDLNVLVKDQNTGAVGRAVLSALLVPATRENSGWDISLGAPSAEKMMRATVRAILNNGKMAVMVADRGAEVLNTWSITTFERLGINADYVPVGDPDAKALIERFNGTVCSGFSNNLPGTTKSSPTERGDYSSENHACLNLEQLRTAYEIWLKAYHNTWQDDLCASPAQKKEQLIATAPPAERYTEEELKLYCVSRWQLRLDGGRVISHHLSWHGVGLPDIRQRLKKKQKAIVRYNPCDLGLVWVAHPDTPDDWRPAIADRPEYQNGLTLGDHELIVAKLLAEKKTFNADNALIAWYELGQYVEECKKADKKKKRASTNSLAPPATNGKEGDVQKQVAGAVDPSLNEADFETLHTRRGKDGDDSGT
ncbi:hypothetical protein [Pseudomonas sp. OA65]|uniref:hypothetical protein n=1 Tax=Pseudomonas sp. OA65 TaxID=2818431 RepID=UPI001A9D1137|nr:hypothetical protein [Pseudomonas sp. OA65]MBO1541255.1 hypothetical protein [Pseudomonas sp. OA65]